MDTLLTTINQSLGGWALDKEKLEDLIRVGTNIDKPLRDTIKDVIDHCITFQNNRYFYMAGHLELHLISMNIPPDIVKAVNSIPTLSNTYKHFVETNHEALVEMINRISETPMQYSYFAVNIMKRVYLLKNEAGNVGELPVHLYLREAFTVCKHKDISTIEETFSLLYNKQYTHASPTLFNGSTRLQQLSSCFLLQTDDSIDGIYSMIKRGAIVSKSGGGLGINLSGVRGSGSAISTGGKSNGLMPIARNIQEMTLYVSQLKKRRGSAAVYINIWHKDVLDIINMRLNNGIPQKRCHDLFSALVIPDVFFARLQEQDSLFTLFCPTDTPELQNLYGQEFTVRYNAYELAKEGLNYIQLPTLRLWQSICRSIFETGAPYLLSRSGIQHSPQSALINKKILQHSNLCAEIVQFTGYDEQNRLHTSVCNLGTIRLPSLCTNNSFNYEMLSKVVKTAIKNLNNVIDVTFYPDDSCKNSNLSLRPVGLGVQGLADLFMKLELPYGSNKARHLNERIFETIYYYALEASCELAIIEGPYEYFWKSVTAKGKLQFDFTNTQPTFIPKQKWDVLRQKIMLHGVRNSLMIALPPTASTAAFLDTFVEGAEPLYSNIYARSLSAGSFTLLNPYLQLHLEKQGIFNQTTINQVVKDNGSVQSIDIPDTIKHVFQTAFEQKMKPLIDMAADRQVFIDQSQSMNLFFHRPNINTFTSAILYAHKKKCKTLLYYLKSRPVIENKKFSLGTKADACIATKSEECLACGS